MSGASHSKSRPRHHRSFDAEARHAVLAEVATLYYVDRLTQEQIARQMGRSVSMVSRMLSEAESAGIVEVRVRQPTPVDAELQAELVRRFGLRVARVLRTSAADSSRSLAGMGELTARYLMTILNDNSTISMGWGTSIYEVVRAVPRSSYPNVHVAQSLGSLGSKLPEIDNNLITRLLAEQLGATPHYLPSPMIVESVALRVALEQDPQIRETLAIGRNASIAMVGIGVPDLDASGMLRAGYVDEEDLETIRQTGAVGDIRVEFFDEYGELKETELRTRVIGVALRDLANAPTVIAVAAGEYKAKAMLGALRLGVIGVLVTDDLTARAVLELADLQPLPDSSPVV